MEAIDTVTPASAAFLYTREGDVMLQHGGICTRITFDRVEQTDLSTFLSEIVPRMKRDASNLTIIRNPTRGEYTFVLGDAVTIYKVNAIEDVGIADMIERLTIKKAQSVYIPDIPYQIIADVQDEQLRKITVRIPEHKSVYRCSDLQPRVPCTPWFRPNRSCNEDCPHQILWHDPKATATATKQLK